MKMNRFIPIFVLFSLIMLVGISAALLSQQSDITDKKGLVAYTEGRVKKKIVEKQDWMTAEKNTPINSGDQLKTYKKSRAELDLLQLDIIRMAPETTIDIVKLYEETKDKVKETKINLQQGDIWAKLSEKDAKMKFDISTPVAAAAITGTVLRMGVKKDSSTELKVYKGEVRISNATAKALGTKLQKGKPTEVPGPHIIPGPKEVSFEQWFYIIKEMQKITISNSGTVQYVGQFSSKDEDEQSKWVKWNLQRENISE